MNHTQLRPAIVLLAALLLIAAAPASAGPPQSQETAGAARAERPRGNPNRHKPDGPGWLGRDAAVFEPSEEDRGPLREGEADDLLEFARTHFPLISTFLTEVQTRNPEQFERRMSEAAPRLRFLRRVYARNPRLGEIVRDYAEQMMRIRRGTAEAVRRSDDADFRAAWLTQMRERVSQTVALEVRALAERADELAGERDATIARRFDALTCDDADLSTEPPALRAAAERCLTLANGPDEEKTQADAALRTMLGRMIDREVGDLRSRAAARRGRAEEEIERRVVRLREELDRRIQERGRGERRAAERSGDAAPRPQKSETESDTQRP